MVWGSPDVWAKQEKQKKEDKKKKARDYGHGGGYDPRADVIEPDAYVIDKPPVTTTPGGREDRFTQQKVEQPPSVFAGADFKFDPNYRSPEQAAMDRQNEIDEERERDRQLQMVHRGETGSGPLAGDPISTPPKPSFAETIIPIGLEVLMDMGSLVPILNRFLPEKSISEKLDMGDLFQPSKDAYLEFRPIGLAEHDAWMGNLVGVAGMVFLEPGGVSEAAMANRLANRLRKELGETAMDGLEKLVQITQRDAGGYIQKADTDALFKMFGGEVNYIKYYELMAKRVAAIMADDVATVLTKTESAILDNGNKIVGDVLKGKTSQVVVNAAAETSVRVTKAAVGEVAAKFAGPEHADDITDLAEGMKKYMGRGAEETASSVDGGIVIAHEGWTEAAEKLAKEVREAVVNSGQTGYTLAEATKFIERVALKLYNQSRQGLDIQNADDFYEMATRGINQVIREGAEEVAGGVISRAPKVTSEIVEEALARGERLLPGFDNISDLQAKAKSMGLGDDITKSPNIAKIAAALASLGVIVTASRHYMDKFGVIPRAPSTAEVGGGVSDYITDTTPPDNILEQEPMTLDELGTAGESARIADANYQLGEAGFGDAYIQEQITVAVEVDDWNQPIAEGQEGTGRLVNATDSIENHIIARGGVPADYLTNVPASIGEAAVNTLPINSAAAIELNELLGFDEDDPFWINPALTAEQHNEITEAAVRPDEQEAALADAIARAEAGWDEGYATPPPFYNIGPPVGDPLNISSVGPLVERDKYGDPILDDEGNQIPLRGFDEDFFDEDTGIPPIIDTPPPAEAYEGAEYISTFIDPETGELDEGLDPDNLPVGEYDVAVFTLDDPESGEARDVSVQDVWLMRLELADELDDDTWLDYDVKTNQEVLSTFAPEGVSDVEEEVVNPHGEVVDIPEQTYKRDLLEGHWDEVQNMAFIIREEAGLGRAGAMAKHGWGEDVFDVALEYLGWYAPDFGQTADEFIRAQRAAGWDWYNGSGGGVSMPPSDVVTTETRDQTTADLPGDGGAENPGYSFNDSGSPVDTNQSNVYAMYGEGLENSVESYGITNQPPWWQSYVPAKQGPLADYLAVLNSVMPYLAPQDAMAVGGNLYRNAPKEFSAYSAANLNLPITQDLDIGLMMNKSWVENMIIAMDSLRAAQKYDAGPGYTWMHDFLNTIMRYLPVEGSRQRLADYEGMLAAIEPMLSSASSQTETAAYVSLARMIYYPTSIGNKGRVESPRVGDPAYA